MLIFVSCIFPRKLPMWPKFYSLLSQQTVGYQFSKNQLLASVTFSAVVCFLCYCVVSYLSYLLSIPFGLNLLGIFFSNLLTWMLSIFIFNLSSLLICSLKKRWPLRRVQTLWARVTRERITEKVGPQFSETGEAVHSRLIEHYKQKLSGENAF